ncbi:hypothetical protein BYT27DRAFT_6722976 [Phlegmacium glaucopus]|nr:hypothetical protein BYT27DRAFT_6722976 [Phlegmacium glaucopus]
MYAASKWARTAATTIPRFLTVRPSTIQSFSTTPRLQAAESEKPFFNADVLDELKRSPTFDKLSRSPDALLAIQKFAKVIEKQDLSSGKPLSMIQMSKLLMNSEFRKGAEDLVEEFKKTGVDGVRSKDLLEVFADFFGEKGNTKGK